MRSLFLICLLAGVAAADEPAPQCCYISRAISCSEADERYVDDIYGTFLTILATKELTKAALTIPTGLADVNDHFVTVHWTFYLTPNFMKGFEIAIPRGSVEVRDGFITVSENLVMKSEDWKQGICLIEMQKKAAEPGATDNPDRPQSQAEKSSSN